MGGWVPGCIEGYQFQLSGISGWLDLVGSRGSPVLGRVPKKKGPRPSGPLLPSVLQSPLLAARHAPMCPRPDRCRYDQGLFSFQASGRNTRPVLR